MTDSMIDRGAKALAHWLEPGSWDHFRDGDREGWRNDLREQARVVIEAMREPTEDMLDAGHLAIQDAKRASGVCGQTVDARLKHFHRIESGAYRAMIDAALKGE